MDVTEKNFKTKLVFNPSLYKYSTIIWRDNWDKQNLIQVLFYYNIILI